MAIISPTKTKKNYHSIRWRILLTYLLIIVLAFGAVAFSLIRLVGDYMFTQRIRDDRRSVETLAERVASPLADMDAASLFTLTSAASLDGTVRILITDMNGTVQFDTIGQANGTRLDTDEVSDILSGEEESYGFYDSINGISDESSSALSSLYACKITQGDLAIGVLIYINSVIDISTSLRSITIKIILWLLIVAAVVAIASIFVMRLFTRPIEELSVAIGEMSKGDLTARVRIHGRNEFSQLGEAFNSMSEKIEALDISRSQFVSNASHELKTPLSTMKILIESILYQDPVDPAMVKDFLGDVNKEIDRLNRIVSDLLTLVNIDSGGMKLQLSDVSLNSLIDEQVRRLLPLARENGIEINYESAEAVGLNADAVKLQQVIYNVIDNAIKYTPRGGTVTVMLSRSGRKAVIRITDTGIGIPAADIEHIFDRFYRVDKARSRATGGTGLGLSIVKQIIQLHSGTISAESEEGKGTTFTIELPL